MLLYFWFLKKTQISHIGGKQNIYKLYIQVSNSTLNNYYTSQE